MYLRQEDEREPETLMIKDRGRISFIAWFFTILREKKPEPGIESLQTFKRLSPKQKIFVAADDREVI